MKKGNQSDAANLRQKAEELLKKKLLKTDLHLHEAEAQKLIHELKVHQVELELQNEELALAKEQAEVATQKYAELYDFAPSGYFTLSKEGKIIELNLNGANMLGKERSRLRNSLFGFFVSDDTKPIFNHFLRKVFTCKANESCEVALSTKDNSPMYVHLTGIVAENGQQCRITLVDITAQKQAFELVEKSNRQKNLILEAVGEGILGIDLAGNLTFINPMAAEILGYCVEELPFKNSHELFHHHHRDGSIYPPEDCPIYSTLRSGKLAFGEEIFVRKNGTYFPVEFTSLPVLENGEITGAVVTFRDITEHKQAIDALRESEEKHRILFMDSPDSFLILIDGIFVDCNRATELMLRGDRSQIIGKSPEILSPEFQPDGKKSSESAKEKIKYALRTGINTFEWVHRRFDGSDFFVEVSIALMKLNGKPALFTAWRDITKRKLAEEALRESEDRYRQLVEMSPDAIAIHQQGKIVYINTAGAIHIGAQTPQEMIGKSILNLVHPDYRAAVIQRVEKTVSGESAPYIVEKFIKLDGTIFDVEVVAIPSVYQGKPATQVIIRDITKRKQAEEALRDSEQRYRLLIEAASEGIVVAQNGFIKFVNPMMQVITDFTHEELLTLAFIDYVYPDDRDIVINNHLKRLKGEPFLPRYQFRIVKKDGSARSVEMNGIVIEWEGQPATLNLLTDITERIQAEEEIQLINEQLLKLNAEKDKFFAIIAHDLRGPFNSFLGMTHLMVEDLPSLTLDQIQELSIDMRNSATNLYRLLENLLQWAKMQQGTIPFNPELLQLLQVVDECVTMVIEQAKNKGIEITFDVPDDLKVFADSNILQTVIRNLVSNAMKFTPKGGKISVSAKANDDKNIEIAVKDTGIGMTSEMVSNLFRLDVKTNRVGTEGEPSSGLGLLLCKEFVEKLGGKIRVESEEGKGSEFKFTLPVGK